MPEVLYRVRDMHLSLPDRAAKPVFGPAPTIEILNGLEFDINRGEVLGIVGGSGSGKSTTGRALVRLPQGRYVQISRGDRVSGWTVSAVSEDAVRIQKGSRNMVLRLPN